MDVWGVGVLPSDALRTKATTLKILLAAQAVLVIAILVLAVQLGLIFDLLNVGLGWYAVKDKDTHRPGPLQYHFFFTVISCAFLIASCAIGMSVIIQSHQLAVMSIVLTCLWASLSALFIFCAVFVWRMYKEMLSCPFSGGGVSAFNYLRETDDQGTPAPAPPQGQQLFTGSGQRLGSS